MKQNTIQDLRRFDEEIFDIVQEYVDDIDIYTTDVVLNINSSTLELSIGETINESGFDSISLVSLTCVNEDEQLEPDTDATFELASKYIFVR